jgi:general stress protein 26
MTKDNVSFDFVKTHLRKRSFGILGTVGKDGKPHSTGVLYGIPPRPSPFSSYVMTGRKYQKTKNVMENAAVTFVVPFPHYYLHFVPSNCVQFQGTAEVLPSNDPLGAATFQQSGILRMNLQLSSNTESIVFIRLRPDGKLHCYGLGMNVMWLRNQHTTGPYVVEVPPERL